MLTPVLTQVYTRVPTKVGFLCVTIAYKGSHSSAHVSAHAGAHASVHEVVWSYLTWSVFTCSVPYPGGVQESLESLLGHFNSLCVYLRWGAGVT